MFLRALSQVLFYCRQNKKIHLLSLQNSLVGLENSLIAFKLRKYIFLIFEIKSEPVSFLVYLKPQCIGPRSLGRDPVHRKFGQPDSNYNNQWLLENSCVCSLKKMTMFILTE